MKRTKPPSPLRMSHGVGNRDNHGKDGKKGSFVYIDRVTHHADFYVSIKKETLNKYKYILIDAPCGRGKTTAVISMLKRFAQPHHRILSITSRITLALMQHAKFNMENIECNLYLDKQFEDLKKNHTRAATGGGFVSAKQSPADVMKMTSRLVIGYESLHNLEQWNHCAGGPASSHNLLTTTSSSALGASSSIMDSYDIVILDELRSTLSSMSNLKTNKDNIRKNATIFQRLLLGAKLVVGIDADMNVDALCQAFVESMLQREQRWLMLTKRRFLEMETGEADKAQPREGGVNQKTRRCRRGRERGLGMDWKDPPSDHPDVRCTTSLRNARAILKTYPSARRSPLLASHPSTGGGNDSRSVLLDRNLVFVCDKTDFYKRIILDLRRELRMRETTRTRNPTNNGSSGGRRRRRRRRKKIFVLCCVTKMGVLRAEELIRTEFPSIQHQSIVDEDDVDDDNGRAAGDVAETRNDLPGTTGADHAVRVVVVDAPPPPHMLAMETPAAPVVVVPPLAQNDDSSKGHRRRRKLASSPPPSQVVLPAPRRQAKRQRVVAPGTDTDADTAQEDTAQTPKNQEDQSQDQPQDQEPSKPVALFISAHSTESFLQKVLQNVNAVVQNNNVLFVAFNSKMGIGIDCTVKVDRMYLDASFVRKDERQLHSPPSREVLQMLYRFRFCHDANVLTLLQPCTYDCAAALLVRTCKRPLPSSSSSSPSPPATVHSTQQKQKQNQNANKNAKKVGGPAAGAGGDPDSDPDPEDIDPNRTTRRRSNTRRSPPLLLSTCIRFNALENRQRFVADLVAKCRQKGIRMQMGVEADQARDGEDERGTEDVRDACARDPADHGGETTFDNLKFEFNLSASWGRAKGHMDAMKKHLNWLILSDVLQWHPTTTCSSSGAAGGGGTKIPGVLGSCSGSELAPMPNTTRAFQVVKDCSTGTTKKIEEEEEDDGSSGWNSSHCWFLQPGNADPQMQAETRQYLEEAIGKTKEDISGCERKLWEWKQGSAYDPGATKKKHRHTRCTIAFEQPPSPNARRHMLTKLFEVHTESTKQTHSSMTLHALSLIIASATTMGPKNGSFYFPSRQQLSKPFKVLNRIPFTWTRDIPSINAAVANFVTHMRILVDPMNGLLDRLMQLRENRKGNPRSSGDEDAHRSGVPTDPSEGIRRTESLRANNLTRQLLKALGLRFDAPAWRDTVERHIDFFRKARQSARHAADQNETLPPMTSCDVVAKIKTVLSKDRCSWMKHTYENRASVFGGECHEHQRKTDLINFWTLNASRKERMLTIIQQRLNNVCFHPQHEVNVCGDMQDQSVASTHDVRFPPLPRHLSFVLKEMEKHCAMNEHMRIYTDGDDDHDDDHDASYVASLRQKMLLVWSSHCTLWHSWGGTVVCSVDGKGTFAIDPMLSLAFAVLISAISE